MRPNFKSSIISDLTVNFPVSNYFLNVRYKELNMQMKDIFSNMSVNFLILKGWLNPTSHFSALAHRTAVYILHCIFSFHLIAQEVFIAYIICATDVNVSSSQKQKIKIYSNVTGVHYFTLKELKLCMIEIWDLYGSENLNRSILGRYVVL
jgi:hypothetical protein